MRELRKFAVDNVAHHADSKLEYIALDSTVERLMRKPKDIKKKGKGKDRNAEKENTKLGVSLEDDDSSSDESSDEDHQPGLKIETLENVRFYDVFGVRIFRKDIKAGKL